MKNLRQYIRRVLLTESAKGIEDLPDNVGIAVKSSKLSKKMKISYCILYPNGKVKSLLTGPDDAERYGVLVWGMVLINKSHTAKNNTWQVAGSFAKDGYGPLLYDVAMELATEKGNGLVSDRTSVSDAAEGVWQYYNDIRSQSDVKVFQADDMSNTLTPQNNDNMDQTISYSKNKDDWKSSPLSKRYIKEPTTINYLKITEKLVML